MTRYVAFLRGMNLGNRRITNDELAGHFADAGLIDPTPYQASGNVVFREPEITGPETGHASDQATGHGADQTSGPAPDHETRQAAGGPAVGLERRIESHLKDALGYRVDVFLRRLDDLAKLAEAEELADAEGQGFKPHVIFLHEPPPPAVREHLDTLENDDDRFLTDDSPHIVWLRRGRLSDSTIDASDPDQLTGGRTATMRTLGTLRRIVAKFG